MPSTAKAKKLHSQINFILLSIEWVSMIFVGTSGWVYDWNLKGNLEWYLKNSRLNAVELNASFYRFPYPNQVKGWAHRGFRLRWAIKVHRSITHYRRLGIKALELWKRFYDLFRPLDGLIDFYLFQLPPNFVRNDKNVGKLENFMAEVGLGPRFAVEFRDVSWFDERTISLLSGYDATFVSVDSPEGTWVAMSNGIIYLRVHGRTGWYYHNYSLEELKELASKIREKRPKKVYVFFNNDHWMLENARLMRKLLEETFT